MRKYINWERDPLLQVAKMLAGVIYVHQGLRGAALMGQFRELLPKVTKVILGRSVTYEELATYIKETQDRILSDSIVLQRADRVNRYTEINDHWDAVLAAVTVNVDQERSFSQAQYDKLVELYGAKCYYCGAPFIEPIRGVADHYIPVSRGGPTELFNGRPACVNCNSRKGDMMPDTFIKALAMANRSGRKGHRY